MKFPTVPGVVGVSFASSVPKSTAVPSDYQQRMVASILQKVFYSERRTRGFVSPRIRTKKDIGGIDGLLHISEISWGKLKHPKEVLEDGQKISVKILSMNEEKGKISLGLKQTMPEPWSVIDDNYSVGQIVQGKVVQIKEYGCFVELEPGLDGLEIGRAHV